VSARQERSAVTTCSSFSVKSVSVKSVSVKSGREAEE
jgi:hypothetical protein